MSEEAVVVVAGHRAERGSSSARRLLLAARRIRAADTYDAAGLPSWATGEALRAGEEVYRARNAPGYLGPAPTVEVANG